MLQGKKIFGIKLEQWKTLLKKRLEVISAGGFLYFLPFAFIGPYILYHTIFYTQFWAIGVIYLIWLYVFDKDTPEQGGRTYKWMLSWKYWKYMQRYFPVTLIKMKGVELDPKRNYLFASFPHGIIGTGVSVALASNACDVLNLFPNHKMKIIVMDAHFKIPIYRDLILTRGFCASSPKSLNFLLGNPNGGYAAVLLVGGVAEQLNTRPGTYELVLKKRKGFVKIALQNGSPLVPVFSFGENDIYTQLPNPRGSWLRKLQEWCKEKGTLAPIIVNGRGIFQRCFGIIPKQKPINVVVGTPIEVTKVDNPTPDQIDALHAKFIEELISLYEENKYKYEKDPDKVKIVIS